MFNKFYLFSEKVDNGLKELGFRFSGMLLYENICQEDSLIVKYEVAKDKVAARRVLEGMNSHRIIRELEKGTFDEIILKLEECLNELKEKHSRIIDINDIIEFSKIEDYFKKPYCIYVNSDELNSFKEFNVKSLLDKENFGYVKTFDAIPVYKDDSLRSGTCKIFY